MSSVDPKVSQAKELYNLVHAIPKGEKPTTDLYKRFDVKSLDELVNKISVAIINPEAQELQVSELNLLESWCYNLKSQVRNLKEHEGNPIVRFFRNLFFRGRINSEIRELEGALLVDVNQLHMIAARRLWSACKKAYKKDDYADSTNGVSALKKASDNIKNYNGENKQQAMAVLKNSSERSFSTQPQAIEPSKYLQYYINASREIFNSTVDPKGELVRLSRVEASNRIDQMPLELSEKTTKLELSTIKELYKEFCVRGKLSGDDETTKRAFVYALTSASEEQLPDIDYHDLYTLYNAIHAEARHDPFCKWMDQEFSKIIS